MSSILKVDEIQNTGGTSALTIDSSGRVFRGVIPAFMVSYNATWVQLSANDVIPFNVDNVGKFFNHGGHFNTSNYAFTAPVTGLYSFLFNAYTAQSDTFNSFAPYLNGSIVNDGTTYGLYVQSGEDAAADHTVSYTFLLNLSANDVIKMHATSGSDIYGHQSHFGGYLIG
jgi:hypothetical protein